MLELFKRERAIIERGRHAKTIVDESFLARAIACVHSADLGNRLVRLVDEEQIILRNVIEQCGWSFARQATAEVARIILYAMAVADGAHHFDIKKSALG